MVTPLNETREEALKRLEDTLERGYDPETVRWFIVAEKGSRVIENAKREISS